MVAWENSREVGRNETSFGLFPFHHRGQRFGLVLALECHLLGVGLGTCLTCLLLGHTGCKETQVIPEPGLPEAGFTSQGMWMKIVADRKEELLLGCDSYESVDGGIKEQRSLPLCPELEEPKVSCGGCYT